MGVAIVTDKFLDKYKVVKSKLLHKSHVLAFWLCYNIVYSKGKETMAEIKTRIKIIKRNGNKEEFDPEKIKRAIRKSAERAMLTLTKEAEDKVVKIVLDYLETGTSDVEVSQIHNCVESALERVNPLVAKSYREYRNYKINFVHVLDKVYEKARKISYLGDVENTTTDTALVSTQRSLTYEALNKELYKKFFLAKEEIEACEEGYIYIHHMDARRDTFSSSVFDIGSIFKNGFWLSNVWHDEPKTLEEALFLMGHIIIHAASMQYGDMTIQEIDKLLEPYVLKSKEKYKKEYLEINNGEDGAGSYVEKKVKEEAKVGYQNLQYTINTLTARGDFPLITFSFGHEENENALLISETILEVHQNGWGKDGYKQPLMLPKIVFLYDKNIHGEGKSLEWLFLKALDCSAKVMYPDYLSLTGKGYVPLMFKQYKKIVSPMGCRAFLAPWYPKGGLKPLDNKDKPVFEGRFSIGVVSLNLPMIYAKAQETHTDFYEVLHDYLEMIRKIHLKTYQYLSKRKASIFPLGFCEGGFYGGHLKPSEAIEPVVKTATASFGVTALNELQELYNGKSLVEDGAFALEVMKYINDVIQEYRERDGYLYVVYGSPAENLCGLQMEQFKRKYGNFGLREKEYMTNSFHCAVWEDISPILKQDLEERFWPYFDGGKITYVRYPIAYNKKAMKTLVTRAMDKGFFAGVNMALSYCNNCGHEELDMDVCPKCGSDDLTKVTRISGYLTYAKVHGQNMLSRAKTIEIAERKSV